MPTWSFGSEYVEPWIFSLGEKQWIFVIVSLFKVGQQQLL